MKKKEKSEQINQPTIKERYQLLIEARKFHYDNFNKWMTYFYVAVGALFVGYCSVVSSDRQNFDQRNIIEFMIIILGYITSLFWYLSSKGYYYWNINFITLVNYYEKDVMKFPKETSIYSVFANKENQNNYFNPTKGANISTSKVAILFAYVITSFWGALLAFKLFNDTNSKHSNCFAVTLVASIFLSILSVFILSWISQFCLASYIDHFPDLKIEQPPITPTI